MAIETQDTTTTTPPTPPPAGPNPPAKPAGLTVPINEDGSIGTLPDQLQKFFDGMIRDRIKDIKSKTVADPASIEKVKLLEEENERFKVEEAERLKNYDEARRLSEERFTKRESELRAEVERRTQRLADMTTAEIKAAAVKLGARQESLDDIAVILGKRVAIDEESLDVIVLDLAGKRIDGGTIEALVKDTLDAKPYFVQPAKPGGGARGGAFQHTGSVGNAEQANFDAALAAWKLAPTTDNMKAFLAAQRALLAKAG